MMKINRLLTNICSDNLPESKTFYTTLFDFKIDFDSDWFVHMISNDRQLELGIVNRTNAIVPQDFQTKPQGFYLTFVVDDVEEIYTLAKAKNYHIVSKPEDTFYGQRRLLIQDPDGTLVDVSSPIQDFKF